MFNSDACGDGNSGESWKQTDCENDSKQNEIVEDKKAEREFYDDGNMNFLELLSFDHPAKHELLQGAKEIADKRRNIVERNFDKSKLEQKIKECTHDIKIIDEANMVDARLIDIELTHIRNIMNNSSTTKKDA